MEQCIAPFWIISDISMGNYMRKCASGGQSLANAERGVGKRGLTRLRPHRDQGRVLHFGLETGCDYITIVRR